MYNNKLRILPCRAHRRRMILDGPFDVFECYYVCVCVFVCTMEYIMTKQQTVLCYMGRGEGIETAANAEKQKNVWFQSKSAARRVHVKLVYIMHVQGTTGAAGRPLAVKQLIEGKKINTPRTAFVNSVLMTCRRVDVATRKNESAPAVPCGVPVSVCNVYVRQITITDDDNEKHSCSTD